MTVYRFIIALIVVSVGSTVFAEPVRDVVFVAHRGGIVPGVPENSLAAFSRCVELGMDAIEIDLRGTKDGEVVIMHDAKLDRTTTGAGPVVERTLAELKQLDLGEGQRVPTYEEVLKTIAPTRVKLLLDIKVSPVLDKEKVVRLTERYRCVLDVIVGARTLKDLHEFHSLNPNLHTLGFISKPEDVEAFCKAGVNIIRLWPKWIHNDPSLVKKVHDLGRPVWTTAGVAGKDELMELIECGVDGVLTDYPERAGNTRL